MTASGLAVMAFMLQAPPGPPARIDDFVQWKRAWKALAPAWKTPIDRALAGGFAADRPAWAFAAGYQAAIQRLVPGFGPEGIAALCITEEGGAHPAGLQCRLTGPAGGANRWRLDGTKTFVSGAGGAEALLVAASLGRTSGGRNRLRMAWVPPDRPGVTVTPLPDLGFVPEVPHGRVRFQGVALENGALLPGDGYSRAVKPFRTLEDLHVTGAFLAWFFAVGRRFRWPAATGESLLALMAAVRTLALAPPREPHVHLALGGLLAQVRYLTDAIAPLWGRVDARTRQWWERDGRILDIAHAARDRRLAAARRHFGAA
jgi:acyl-CoA dehydrogenase